MCPIYAFQCNECGQEFESLMKPTDPVRCSKCGMNNATKLVSVTAPHVWRGSSEGAMPKKPGGKSHG